jgi:hypothetical protein
MELQLKIIGILLIFLSFVHLIFPKYFNWKKELESLNLVNKQLMIVHTFFVALVVFLMGLLCLFSSEDLISTKLGRKISLGLFIFWGTRLIFQFFVYSSKLWKGKLFETIVHVLFSLIWIYLTVIFFMVWKGGK